MPPQHWLSGARASLQRAAWWQSDGDGGYPVEQSGVDIWFADPLWLFFRSQSARVGQRRALRPVSTQSGHWIPGNANVQT